MFSWLSLLVVCALARVNADDVLDYSGDDFSDRIGEHDVALVEFFAPWCGHCKRLAPEYEKAATVLKDNDPPVALVKVDCTSESGGKDTCSKFGVSGYPTLKIFRGGEFSSEYQGPREQNGIVSFMRKQVGPSAKPVLDKDAMEKFIGNSEPSVVGFFAEDSDLKKAFLKTADNNRDDYRFAYTEARDVIDKYGYQDDAVVLFYPPRLHNKFEEKQLVYEGKSSENKIKTWLKDNVLGLCGHMTDGNADKFKKPLVVAYYDVDYVKNAKGSNYWRNRVLKVATKLKEEGKEVYFAIAARGDFYGQLSEFGLDSSSSDKPVVAARDTSDDKFIMKDEFSVDNLEKFVRDFLDGKVKRYLKSEPVPEDNDGPVKVVVAENFDEIVMDDTKDVLIEFYAPWCGHCKNLAPKWDELGEKLKDTESIVIAKMDATANDTPGAFKVSGFPTIFWAPAGGKDNPEKYNGGREVDDFMSFLKRKATHARDEL
ncbi:protein disulfide-isomerase A3-like [Branchiostoma floridae]|uniref:Protein disulfide-isomerase n=1 Tax=Branchiostoma floridae TaxID=7739 RepID=A0A9J7KNK0_BRAFL|nr:protein disulfide-isomerase A3-like [Branchiostoma floridae]